MRLKVLLLALVFAISCVGFMTTSAKAEGPSVTPYADVMMWFGATQKDKDASYKVDKKGKAVADTDVIMGLTPQGDIGVRGTANNVNVNFAIMSKSPGARYKGATAFDEGQTYMFIGLISANFGSVNLMVGRFFTPYDIVAFNDVACPDTVFGWYLMLDYALFDATRDMIKISVSGFYVGLFKNNYTDNKDAGNYDVMLPLTAAGYEYGNPGTPMHFSAHGLFQTYKIDNVDMSTGAPVEAAGNDKSVTSYAAAGKFGMNMAPATFYVTAYYGSNVGDMGFPGGSSTAVGNKIYNATTYAGHAGADYTVGIYQFGVAVGYKSVKYDKKALVGDKADNSMALAAKVKISPMPNFGITPCIRYADAMKNAKSDKEGKTITVGVLFDGHI